MCLQSWAPAADSGGAPCCQRSPGLCWGKAGPVILIPLCLCGEDAEGIVTSLKLHATFWSLKEMAATHNDCSCRGLKGGSHLFQEALQMALGTALSPSLPPSQSSELKLWLSPCGEVFLSSFLPSPWSAKLVLQNYLNLDSQNKSLRPSGRARPHALCVCSLS